MVIEQLYENEKFARKGRKRRSTGFKSISESKWILKRLKVCEKVTLYDCLAYNKIQIHFVLSIVAKSSVSSLSN